MQQGVGNLLQEVLGSRLVWGGATSVTQRLGKMWSDCPRLQEAQFACAALGPPSGLLCPLRDIVIIPGRWHGLIRRLRNLSNPSGQVLKHQKYVSANPMVRFGHQQ